jgi:hypothetical protein
MKTDSQADASTQGAHDPVASHQAWKTIVEMARRYGISDRMVAYLAEDRILPTYKIGRAVRFDPKECDIAMRLFRRASKFDTQIQEELTTQLERNRELENHANSCAGDPRRLERPLNRKRPKSTKAGEFRGEQGPKNHGKTHKRRGPHRLKSSCRMLLPGGSKIPIFWAN